LIIAVVEILFHSVLSVLLLWISAFRLQHPARPIDKVAAIVDQDIVSRIIFVFRLIIEGVLMIRELLS
jgi:hypothetical protein